MVSAGQNIAMAGKTKASPASLTISLAKYEAEQQQLWIVSGTPSQLNGTIWKVGLRLWCLLAQGQPRITVRLHLHPLLERLLGFFQSGRMAWPGRVSVDRASSIPGKSGHTSSILAWVSDQICQEQVEVGAGEVGSTQPHFLFLHCGVPARAFLWPLSRTVSP